MKNTDDKTISRKIFETLNQINMAVSHLKTLSNYNILYMKKADDWRRIFTVSVI